MNYADEHRDHKHKLYIRNRLEPQRLIDEPVEAVRNLETHRALNQVRCVLAEPEELAEQGTRNHRTSPAQADNYARPSRLLAQALEGKDQRQTEQEQ